LAFLGKKIFIMNYESMTNTAIAAELGSRLERLRLERNMSQQTLAGEIGITPKSYRLLVAGGGKLENMIAALRALNALGHLDNFLPETPPSPLEQLKLRGKKRQRARNFRYSTHKPKPPMGVQENELDW
jgi:transcriptional regulator with XRE-family HTH domain